MRTARCSVGQVSSRAIALALLVASATIFSTGVQAGPENPVLVGHTPFNAVPLFSPPIAEIDGPYDIAVSGNFAFVTNERRGSIAVIDIADPDNPIFVAETPHPGLTNGRGIALDGSFAYFADPKQNALGIFDVSNPLNPLFVSKVSSSSSLKGAHSVAVAGDYAYVGTQDADSIVVIDVSDKAQPRIVGGTQGPAPGVTLNGVREVFLQGNYLYVAPTSGSGLAIIDVSDPTRPVWKSSAPCPGGPNPALRGVMVVENYAYVACANNSAFGIIDVSDPENPVAVGSTRGPQPGKTFTYASSVYVSGNYAYVPLSHFNEPDGKVIVVDVSDKTQPIVVGQTTEVREAQTAFAVGDYLYTASDAWDAFMVFYVGPEPSPPHPPPAPSCSLSADPSTIVKGQRTVISWTTESAVSGTILGLEGKTFVMNPVHAGSLGDAPNRTVKYSGSVADDAGGQPGTCGLTVTVGPAPPPPTVSITASPNPVVAGGATTLTWSSTNATSCMASDGWSGEQPTSGTQSFENLTSTTTYTLTCAGLLKSSSASVTVSVTPPPPPTVTIEASPTSVAYGGSTTLTWSSTDATSCTASDGWSGEQPTAGTRSFENLTSTTTYTLTCAGPSDRSSASVTVTVSPPTPPTVTIEASPTSVAYGGSTTLTWSSTDATSCMASAGWSGAQPTAGTQSFESLTITTTYALTCDGPVESASAGATVTVASPPPPPPTVAISAEPTSIPSGGSTTLSWSSTDAVSCVASGGWSGPQPTSGTQLLANLTSTATYTLTCSGEMESASASVTVSVIPPPVLVLVDRTAGTLFGDMAAEGGLSAAFDGIAIQTGAASAGKNATAAAYIGKTFSSQKVFGRMVVRGAKDGGFVLANNNSITLTVYGKNGSPPTSPTNGTVLGTRTFVDAYNPPAQAVDSTNLNAAWTYVWVHMSASAGSLRIAEIDLYEWK